MGRRILLVEGKNDRFVVDNLRDVHGIARSTFEVEMPRTAEEAEGINASQQEGGDRILLDSLPWRLATSDLECLAVVIDADTNGPISRWTSIRDRLLKAGYEGVPENHVAEGTVFELSLRPRTPRSVRFSVWIMPDNRSPGMLEDFVVRLIREDDATLPFVDRFLDSIPPDRRRFSPTHRPKARIHSWLAVSDTPGRPMGLAIKADKLLDGKHPSVSPFIAWIRRALLD
jgi:hypothetical protein